LTAAAVWGADGTASVERLARRPVRLKSVVRSDPKTGKLVRSLVVTPKAVAERKVEETGATSHTVALSEPASTEAAAAIPAGFDQQVQRIASQQGLPPELLHSVIKVESNYNPYAVSSKGALGIMQLIPATARRFGVADVFDPVENVEGGARYLKFLLDLFNGDFRLALAAYNAGENAVAKYGDVPPYRETQNYIKLVGRHVEEAQRAAATKTAEQKPAPVVESKPDGNHLQEIVEPDGTVHYVTRY
jgi:soluble lytic murein transglycosylase-like protein